MRGRLQHPALAVVAALPLRPLEELQHAVEVMVGRREVLGVDPGAVPGDVAARLRNVREERIGQEHDLLVRLVGRRGVDRVQLRRERTHLGEARLRVGDARVRRVEARAGTRRGLTDLPAQGAVAVRIAGEQSLDQRGARAHHADDHDRARDALLGDLGVSIEPVDGAQPLDEACGGSSCAGPASRRRSGARRRGPRAAAAEGSRKASSPKSSSPVFRRAPASREASSKGGGSSRAMVGPDWIARRATPFATVWRHGGRRTRDREPASIATPNASTRATSRAWPISSPTAA